MQKIQLHSFMAGLRGGKELWLVFCYLSASVIFLAIGLGLILAVVPELGVFAIFVPALILMVSFLRKRLAYKTRVLDPFRQRIQQANESERIGLFLFLSFFMGAIGCGGGFLLSATVYGQMTKTASYDFSFDVGIYLYYGFLVGAFAMADIFKKKGTKYAIYGSLALILLLSYA